MVIALYIVEIILSIALIALVLLQGKSGGLGGIFGGDNSVYKTRRGVEKLLYQATIGLSALFFVVAFALIILNR